MELVPKGSKAAHPVSNVRGHRPPPLQALPTDGAETSGASDPAEAICTFRRAIPIDLYRLPVRLRDFICEDTPTGTGMFGTVFKAERLVEPTDAPVVLSATRATTSATLRPSIEPPSVVAIKCIPFRPRDGRKRNEAIVGDLAILARLNRHPNIITFFGYFEDDPPKDPARRWLQPSKVSKLPPLRQMCLVFELAAGTLDFELQHVHRFCSQWEAWVIGRLRDVVHGLKHMHELGIMHRDIKEKNILVSPDGTAKLCDFGVSIEADTCDGTRVGTTGYLAPEIQEGREYTAKVECWALGIVAYKCLVGCRPRVPGMKSAELNQTPKVPDWVPKHAQSLLRKLLDVNPNTRLSATDAAAHPFLLVKPEPTVPFLKRDMWAVDAAGTGDTLTAADSISTPATSTDDITKPELWVALSPTTHLRAALQDRNPNTQPCTPRPFHDVKDRDDHAAPSNGQANGYGDSRAKRERKATGVSKTKVNRRRRSQGQGCAWQT